MMHGQKNIKLVTYLPVLRLMICTFMSHSLYAGSDGDSYVS